jgi:hypothetical protein
MVLPIWDSSKLGPILQLHHLWLLLVLLRSNLVFLRINIEQHSRRQPLGDNGLVSCHLHLPATAQFALKALPSSTLTDRFSSNIEHSTAEKLRTPSGTR